MQFIVLQFNNYCMTMLFYNLYSIKNIKDINVKIIYLFTFKTALMYQKKMKYMGIIEKDA